MRISGSPRRIHATCCGEPRYFQVLFLCARRERLVVARAVVDDDLRTARAQKAHPRRHMTRSGSAYVGHARDADEGAKQTRDAARRPTDAALPSGPGVLEWRKSSATRTLPPQRSSSSPAADHSVRATPRRTGRRAGFLLFFFSGYLKSSDAGTRECSNALAAVALGHICVRSRPSGNVGPGAWISTARSRKAASEKVRVERRRWSRRFRALRFRGGRADDQHGTVGGLIFSTDLRVRVRGHVSFPVELLIFSN